MCSCSHFLDNAVQIWDVRRPYIPFGTFIEHTDDVTGKDEEDVRAVNGWQMICSGRTM